VNTYEIMQAYPELAHLQDGEETKVNHVGCEAGTDRKQRLYVKRDGGTLLFYCHHCATGGSRGARRNYIRSDKRENVVSAEVSLPQDMVCRHDMMDVHANVWLNKAGLTQEEREAYHIGWSPSHGRVILPVYTYTGRKLLPKYLTTRRGDVKHPAAFGKHHRESTRIVIVEDILSMIKVNRVEMSVALLGTSLPDWLVFWLAGHHDVAVVWLDNDNAAVRKKQREIASRLAQFMERVHIVRSGSDPKLHSADEIREVLTKYE